MSVGILGATNDHGEVASHENDQAGPKNKKRSPEQLRAES
jgi:hypothetical protein